MDRRPVRKQTEPPIIPAVDLDDEMRELADLALLEDDWDSFGSKPISHAAIADANNLMIRAAIQHSGIRPYAIAPLSGSGVQLEWRGYNHRLEVEVYGNQRFHSLLIEGQGAHRREGGRGGRCLADA